MDGRCSLERKNIMQSTEVREGMVCAWFIRVRLVIGGNDPEAEASSAESLRPSLFPLDRLTCESASLADVAQRLSVDL